MSAWSSRPVGRFCGTASFRRGRWLPIVPGVCLLSATGRVLVGWLFVHAGWRVLRRPGPATSLSAPSLAMLRARLPFVPAEDVLIVRANAAVHVTAGSLFMAGRAQRMSSLVLAASLVPTTAAGHAFWTISDPAQRRTQRAQFDKDVAIFGGLLACWPAGRGRGRGIALGGRTNRLSRSRPIALRHRGARRTLMRHFRYGPRESVVLRCCADYCRLEPTTVRASEELHNDCAGWPPRAVDCIHHLPVRRDPASSSLPSSPPADRAQTDVDTSRCRGKRHPQGVRTHGRARPGQLRGRSRARSTGFSVRTAPASRPSYGSSRESSRPMADR